MNSVKTQSLYASRFSVLKEKGQKAFIPFTVLGWPNEATSRDILKTMIQSGVSALELGLAFSDPSADGPIIQKADTETLEMGFGVDDAFRLIAEARKLDNDIPIGLLVYYNLLLARGIEKFIADYAKAGGTGLLIADLPPEAAQEVLPFAQQHGVDLIFIVSPLTSSERLAQINTVASGFLYVVSRLGITGTEARYDTDLKALLDRIHQNTTLPACVGFGISTPEQANNMLELGADGVITGSRIIQLVRESNPQTMTADLGLTLGKCSQYAVLLNDVIN